MWSPIRREQVGGLAGRNIISTDTGEAYTVTDDCFPTGVVLINKRGEEFRVKFLGLLRYTYKGQPIGNFTFKV